MTGEKWGSRIGMILAMSGSAIGLGNLRKTQLTADKREKT
jgi:SNF family Na+-dependent transporter